MVLDAWRGNNQRCAQLPPKEPHIPYPGQRSGIAFLMANPEATSALEISTHTVAATHEVQLSQHTKQLDIFD